MDALTGALFNLRLPPASTLIATTAFMAACNKRVAALGYDSYNALICPALPDGSMPVAAAAAVALLGARGETITDNFRRLASWWFRGYENVHEKLKDNVVAMIRTAWPGPLESESPLHRRLQSFGVEKGFHKIVRDMQSKFPKRPSSPKE
jgi:hypothetical protein